MSRDLLGFLAGIGGGVIALVLYQITYAIRISTVNMVVIFSRMLGQASSITVWIISLIITGLVGWLVARWLPRQYQESYLTSGLVLGVIVWGAMNLFIAASGVATPTWSVGLGNFIVNLVIHLVLGIVITYSIWRYGAEVTDRS